MGVTNVWKKAKPYLITIGATLVGVASIFFVSKTTGKARDARQTDLDQSRDNIRQNYDSTADIHDRMGECLGEERECVDGEREQLERERAELGEEREALNRGQSELDDLRESVEGILGPPD